MRGQLNPHGQCDLAEETRSSASSGLGMMIGGIPNRSAGGSSRLRSCDGGRPVSLTPSNEPAQGQFPTTRWSRVIAARNPHAPETREAVAILCNAYWYPLYAYVRRKGHGPEAAQDLTQEFFAYVLEHDLFSKADP